MNAIIQQFQNELNPEERRRFEAEALRAGRRPGAHLKAVLFGSRQRPAALPGEPALGARPAVSRTGRPAR